MVFKLEKLKQGLPHFYEKFGKDFVIQIGHIVNNADDLVSLEIGISNLFSSREGNKYPQELAIALSGTRFADDTGTDETKTSETKPIQNEIIKLVAQKIETKEVQFEDSADSESSTN